MNHVYIITEGSYSDYHIIAVYSTKKGAEKFIETYNILSRGTVRSDMTVEEFALDQAIPSRNMYRFSMSRNGNIGLLYACYDICNSDVNEMHYFKTTDTFTGGVWADNTDAAIKILGELRTRYIIEHPEIV